MIATYLRASDLVPSRAEALHAASRYCRDRGRNTEGYELARRGIELPQPAGALFVQPWIYDYGLLDEYAINAYWAGAYRESLDASLRLLGSNKLPESMRERVAANARFAADKLEQTQPTPLINDEVPVAAAAALSAIAIAAGQEDTPRAEVRHDTRPDTGPCSPEPTFRSCPVCGGTGTTKPRLDLEPHPYVRCDGCGLFYQPNMRTKVFEGHHETRGDLMSPADREANRLLALAFYRNHLAAKFAGQALFHLDIGSKYPYFGHCLQAVAAEHGRQLTSHAIDGIPEAREFGRQLGVLMAIGNFEEEPESWNIPSAMRQRIAEGGFHCVSLIHCLEHFYDPLQTLRKIRELMVDGGILFIRSPDSEAPGIERDFTAGHYDIHPTIWCESAMYEALAKMEDAFTIYETYELGHQRDYLLRAVGPVSGGVESIPESFAATIARSLRDGKPAIVNILRPGAIGDVLATSAVTAQLAARHPGVEICYYTKFPQTAELLVGVKNVFDADQWEQRKRGADLILIGYPIREGYPERPMQKHLTAYFCAEAGLLPALPQLREEVAPFPIEQRYWVTIHPKAGWSVYKEWSIDNWNEIITRVHQTYPQVVVVQIGGSGDPALHETDYDLRGRTSVSQTLWLVKNSVLHLGVDSFTNHAAGAFRHPAVIVFGSTSPMGSGYDTAA
ncbi:MAG: methyltransferase domain-containing protein, partial [Acetobacteraceae bacterium]|nr:methyltransferase domain-containing protein [Acetobacteraceae bacterium]